MEDLVDHGRGQVLDGLALALGKILEARFQRLLELALPDLLEPPLERHDGGDLIQGRQPPMERLHLLIDDLLPLVRLAFPPPQVLPRHVGEVVDVIEVDVVQVVDERVEVPGHAEVDEEHVALLALPQHLDRGIARHQRLLRLHGTDDHVRQPEIAAVVLETDGAGLETIRQFHRLLEGAVGDHQAVHAVLHQVAHQRFTHGAGADDHDGLFLQPVENAPGQIHRHRAHGHRPVGDARVLPHPLGHGEGAVEEPVEDAADGARLLRDGVVLLQLTEDLWLAHDHGVEAGGHAEDVPHRVLACVVVELVLGGLQVDVGLALEKVLDLGESGVAVPRHHHHFHPVARGQDHPLVHRRQRQQILQGAVDELGRERELLSHLHGRGAVIHADHEDLVRDLVHRVTQSGLRAGSGRRHRPRGSSPGR